MSENLSKQQEETTNKDSPIQQRTHDLATLAVSFAFIGVMMAMTGPWLVIPSLLCAHFGNRAILREPERYKGKFFIQASIVLNILTLLTFIAFFYGQTH